MESMLILDFKILEDFYRPFAVNIGKVHLPAV